jgi:hypothetical protein
METEYRATRIATCKREAILTAQTNAAQQSAIFIPTIEDFVSGKLGAQDSETLYLTLVKKTPGRLDPAVSAAVNQLFTDVDAFVSDDQLRDEDDLDEQQLLACAHTALRTLIRLRDS